MVEPRSNLPAPAHGVFPLAEAAYRPGQALGGHIRYLLALARRNLLLIGGIVGFALAVAVLLFMLETPRYRAVASIQIEDRNEEVLGEAIEGSTQANTNWDIDRFLNTQLGILQSRTLAQRVARRLDLARSDAFFTAMETTRPAGPDAERAAGNLAVALLQSNMRVELPQSTRIAQISVSSADPAMSARIADAFAEEFIQANLQRRFDSSAYARRFVAEQLDEVRGRLEASERKLNAYARQAGLIRMRGAGAGDEERRGSVTADSLAQINAEANAAQARRVAAEGRWNAERATSLLSSQAVLANPTIQQLMTRRSSLNAELEEARTRYLDEHPGLARLEGELAGINQQIGAVAGQVRASIRTDYLAARDAETKLRAQVARLEGATLTEQDRSVQYNILARETDTNRSLYDGLLERYRQLNAAAGIATSNISIVDKAELPQTPSSPDMMRYLVISLAVGLGLAGLAVFVRDQMDDRIRVPEDVEHKIHLPLLGVVLEDAQGDPLAALADPKSVIAEAYNSLRSSLFFATSDGLPRILLVTSAEPGEGKSTTSFALARSMALIGKRTLLIDGDLRRPVLHRMTGCANAIGLSSVLTAQAELDKAVLPSDQPGLSLLPSGPVPPSPTELLASPRMARLLEDLSRTYDAVIIDSAPVLGLADSPILSAIADGVVIVIEAGRARGGMLKAAIRRLRAMNPLLVGAVLTRFNPEAPGHGYSGYYGYSYYRYETEQKATA